MSQTGPLLANCNRGDSGAIDQDRDREVQVVACPIETVEEEASQIEGVEGDDGVIETVQVELGSITPSQTSPVPNDGTSHGGGGTTTMVGPAKPDSEGENTKNTTAQLLFGMYL